MRDNKRTSKKKGSPRLSNEKRGELEKVAAEFGIKPPRPGEELDRQFTSSSNSEKDEPEFKTVYQFLAEIVGVKTLDTIEFVTYVVLGGMLFAFLATGLAFASEAFFKASQSEVPSSLDNFVTAAEKWFTPLLLSFIALSSVLGLYKQSQLNSGTTQYDESKQSDQR